MTNTLKNVPLVWITLAHEASRTYTFPGGDTVKVENVTHLCVRESDNHRLKTSDGRLVIVKGNWIALDVAAPDFEV